MATFRHEITIARPVEVVFAAVADVTTHPKWQQGLQRTEQNSRETNRVGAKGAEVRRMLGRDIRFPYEITFYDANSAWGFRALSGPIRPSAVLKFLRQNDGTVVKSELTVPGFMGPLFGRMLLSQQKRNYLRLKELLEAGKL